MVHVAFSFKNKTITSRRAATSVALNVRERKHMAHTVDAPPPTTVEPVTEVLHGIEITDPYRWLEDQNSPRTRKWLEEQAEYTRKYFVSIPDRERIGTRVGELLALKEVISQPWKVSDRHFFQMRQAGREQPVIVMRNGLFGTGLFGTETVLVDPAQRGSGNSVAVSITAISADGRFLAYSVRKSGTDHSSLEILDVKRGVVLPDRLPEGFCTGIVFAPDGSGFYYSHRELNDLHPNYRAAFWHQFGTERSEDRKTFVAGEEPGLFLGILDSSEANLLAYATFLTGRVPLTSLYVQELSSNPHDATLVVEGVEGCFVPFFMRGQLLAYTDLGAPNFRIVRIDLADANPSNWRDVVPESDKRIQQFAVADDQVFVTRVDRFSTSVDVFGPDGGRKETPPFPSRGTIDLLNRTKATDS